MHGTFHNRLLMGVAIAALSLGSSQAMASGGADTQWATVDNHGFLGIDLMLEGGYNFSHGDLTYGQINDGSTIDTGTKIDLGEGFNGKAGVSARFEGGWKFGLNYSGIRSDKNGNTGTFDDTNTATTYPVWNVLGNTTTSYNEISVSTSSKVDMIDLTVGYDVGLGNSSSLVLTSGLRYGNFNQTTNTDIWCSAHVCGTRSYEYSDQLKSSYQGLGPILGASYSVPVSDNGFSVFGSALGSVLFGKQKTSRWDNNGGGTVDTSDNHVAYTAEAEAGLSYKLPGHPATVSLGYQLSYFDKVRDTTNGTGATGNESYGNSKDSMLYHGPFARLVISLP